MRTVSRMIELASERPGEALTDVIGLAVICVMIFGGFAITSFG